MKQPTPPTLHTIGTAERVSFPELGYERVPAKIDTGADSSAISATEIGLNPNGRLGFVLFSPGNRHYTSERLEAERFRSTMVKNTSGVAEPRYKVSLQVQIGDRKIRAWFNLSDRSGMRYPVLIGRRLLHNKFIVDVSKRHLHSEDTPAKRVLVLGAPEKNVGEFFADIAERCDENVRFDSRSFKEILFRIQPNQVLVSELIGGRDIANYDLVHFKTHRQYYEFAISAAEYLECRHTRFFDRELAEHVAYDKLTEMMRLALSGLPVPLTFCGMAAALSSQANEIIEEIGLPLVCKEINADRGRSNYLLQSKKELLEILETAKPGERYIVQQYVENDGYVRALVFGEQVALMVGKHAVEAKHARKAHLNNPFGGHNAYLIKPVDEPQGVRELALAAARQMRRQIAGVDLIYGTKTQQWYILEANAAPQIRTGAFLEEKAEAFAKFIGLQLNG